MNATVSPLAGAPPTPELLIDAGAVTAAYADIRPDPQNPAQRVAFGTSGHRGSALLGTFNEWHVAAITQAVCNYRRSQQIGGPLFLGADTHALSEPAAATALEVLAGNSVEVRIAGDAKFTPTPAVSLAILDYERESGTSLADGIILTPSHNPPASGGIKYNPPTGGPAAVAVSDSIEQEANRLLAARLSGVRRLPLESAREAASTGRFDFLDHYVRSLPQVIDVAAIARSGIRLAVDPLGGAGVEYWGAIGERYGLCLTVLNQRVDPTFRFVCVDWDGQIRMDPSSRYAMRGLTSLVDGYDLAGACDTDHDRHGIVVPGSGLMPANDYLAVMTAYLCRHRPDWPMKAAVGKTVVTTLMLNRVAARYGRGIFEVPVGFKWFTDGLLSGALAVAGEESAGASFARLDGSPWTTDKDGIVAVLLAAEMTAREGRNPVEQHAQLSRQLGHSVYRRVDAAATPAQKARMTRLDPERLRIRHLAGEAVTAIETRAPGNGEPLGGMRVTTANGWIALRASGTEDLYKLYAESFIGERHLQQLLEEGGRFVDEVLSGD